MMGISVTSAVSLLLGISKEHCVHQKGKERFRVGVDGSIICNKRAWLDFF